MYAHPPNTYPQQIFLARPPKQPLTQSKISQSFACATSTAYPSISFMARTIVTKGDVEAVARSGATRSIDSVSAPVAGVPDGYLDKLLKYIPTEMVGAYVALNGLLNLETANPSASAEAVAAAAQSAGKIPDATKALGCFVLLVLLTPLYQIFVAKVKKPVQWVLSIPAFFIWSLAIGGMVHALPYLSTLAEAEMRQIGAIFLIFFTLIVPLINPGDAKPEAPTA